MKLSLTATAVLLAASMAFAQAKPTPGQSSGQSGQTQGQTQSGVQTAASGNAQAQPPSGGQRVLQAKSQDELKAYQDAFNKTDPAQMETAADEFAAKYPASELRASLYIRAMSLYGQTNNAEKVVATGRKAIAADPINPVPLVQVATALAEGTRDTDLDREDRLNEAAKDAQAAIDNLDKGLIIPPNAPPDKVAAAKASILIMAYDTLGMVNMNRKDYAAAEHYLQKAADTGKSPEPVLYLRLSVAQDQLKKYPQALENANKAVQYSANGSVVQNLAKQQQARLQKLAAAGSANPGSATPAPAPNTPAAQGSGQTPSAPPH